MTCVLWKEGIKTEPLPSADQEYPTTADGPATDENLLAGLKKPLRNIHYEENEADTAQSFVLVLMILKFCRQLREGCCLGCFVRLVGIRDEKDYPRQSAQDS